MKKPCLCAVTILLAATWLAAVPRGDAAAQPPAIPQGDAAAQPPAIAISPLPYGINVHLAQNATLAKVKAAGIAWIRIDIDWNVIEASRGKFNYVEVDRVVNYAAANGLSVYASIGYTPKWANGRSREWWKYPAAKITDWKNFVARTVARFKSKVKYWSIWNEPNSQDFFVPGKDTFLNQVLLPGIQAVRGADPAAFIAGPELAHLTSPGSEWYFWMKYILDNAGGSIDIISHHIYEDHGVYYIYELLEEGDKFIPAVKRIIEESGQGGKPFWITETGWSTGKYSEIMQAARYQDMLHARARKNYPHKLFFYEIIDVPGAQDPLLGILRFNLDPKPAYTTYRDYIAGLLPDPGDPDADRISKKCYAEQTAGNAAPAHANPKLMEMVRARDFLRGYSAGAVSAVDVYYQWNEEFLKIALADSRVYRLGREIVEQATDLLAGNPLQAMAMPLPEPLYRSARALVSILKSEYGESPLAPLIQLADRHLDVSGKASLHELLEFYLSEDMRGLSKNR